MHANRAERRRQRVARARGSQGVLPAAEHQPGLRVTRSSARRCSAAAARRATTQSPGAMRARPTRSASTSSRTARCTGIRTRRGRRGGGASRRRAALIRTRKVGVVAGRPFERRHAHGGRPAPAREFPAAGAGLGAGQAGVPLRRDVERRARLHQPVGQGRARHRRGHRRRTPRTRSAARCTSTCTRSRRSASCFPCFRRLRMLRNWGGIVDVTPDRSPIIGTTPVPGPLRELRLGHRRLQGDARLRARLRVDDGEGRAAPDRRAVLARTFPRPDG